MFSYPHKRLWIGPVWPYATTQTLVGLANLLNWNKQTFINNEEYFRLLNVYTQSLHMRFSDGKAIRWIDEDLHPSTGEWIARSILHKLNRPDKDRGRDYNHSGYCDIIITGLVGLRPRADDVVEVNQLVPEGK